MRLQNVPINYNLLAAAVDFYAPDFKQIEVPWIVDAQTSLLTAPPNGVFCLDDGRHLVGSAEQGFLQMAAHLQRDIPYYSISPCFRKGESDSTHSEWFIKLELFLISDNPRLFVGLGSYAERFFTSLLGKDSITPIYTDSDGSFDLMHNGLELGSYGRRVDPLFGNFHFGTGLALPRFQLAMNEMQ